MDTVSAPTLATPASVRLVQEWLTLHDHAVAIDGAFGPATEAALRRFQLEHLVPADEIGRVGPATAAHLIAPRERATARLGGTCAGAAAGLRGLIVAYAYQHLAEHPREVGGPNAGPWVRLYCDGKDGPAYAWCAGFVHYVIKQAALHAGVPCPTLDGPGFLSCDRVAEHARSAGRLRPDGERPEPGDVFLKWKPAGQGRDYNHAGIVLTVAASSFTSAEGNTNADGSRDGYEAIERTRAYGNVAFIRVA